jgi:hypothetical protein
VLGYLGGGRPLVGRLDKPGVSAMIFLALICLFAAYQERKDRLRCLSFMFVALLSGVLQFTL